MPARATDYRSPEVDRYLFRVRYDYPDATVSYEPICIRAESEAAARTEADAATERYPSLLKATKVLTLTLVTPDV